MINFKQLQTICKQEIFKAFESFFNIELKHPDYEKDIDYTVRRSYLTTQTIKKIFITRFESKKLKLDLRKIETWGEILLQCREKINSIKTYRETKMAFLQEVNRVNNEQLEKLNTILKEMKIAVSDRFGSVFNSGGYNTRKKIKGTNYEIGYGSYIVDAEFFSEKFLNHFQHSQKKFAIFLINDKTKYNQGGYIERIEDIKETEKWIVKNLSFEQLKLEIEKLFKKEHS